MQRPRTQSAGSPDIHFSTPQDSFSSPVLAASVAEGSAAAPAVEPRTRRVGGSSKRHIFVIGLDEANRRQLATVRGAEGYAFHGLIPFEKIVSPREYPMQELMDEAIATLDDFQDSIDAIIAHWDFPISMMLPLLRERYDLPGPSLRSVVQAEHKYWSRLTQRDTVPEVVRNFAAVDPFADDPIARVKSAGLDFPFWIKPVKAHSSYLGFHIHDQEEFDRALPIIRERIGRLKEPLDYFLDRIELPPEVVGVDGGWCIAEELISKGHQCTLEGYVHRGDVVVYGVIDSLREEAVRSVLSRYRYPSRLPESVQSRMIDATRRLLEASELDDSPFNIEFYWDDERDTLCLLEINPRISKSHCPLFELVAGASHHEVLIDLALGRRPEFPRQEGRYPVATKWMLRRQQDAFVRRVPRPDEVREVERAVPGCRIVVEAREGQRLSELEDQDSYTYEYASVFIGGEDEEDIRKREQRVEEMLPFEFVEAE